VNSFDLQLLMVLLHVVMTTSMLVAVGFIQAEVVTRGATSENAEMAMETTAATMTVTR
jgi:hypothetical protein